MLAGNKTWETPPDCKNPPRTLFHPSSVKPRYLARHNGKHTGRSTFQNDMFVLPVTSWMNAAIPGPFHLTSQSAEVDEKSLLKRV
jgi:hypothetical protein